MNAQEIINSHVGLIRYFAAKYTSRRREFLEDVFQETAVVILRRAHKFDLSHIGQHLRWCCLEAMYRVYRDAGILRGSWKNGGKPVYVTVEPIVGEPPGRTEEIELEKSEVLERFCGAIGSALGKLTSARREVITRTFGLGGARTSSSSIAVEWGCTHQNIQQLRAKALTQLAGWMPGGIEF